jgi:hypothetical protein
MVALGLRNTRSNVSTFKENFHPNVLTLKEITGLMSKYLRRFSS